MSKVRWSIVTVVSIVTLVIGVSVIGLAFGGLLLVGSDTFGGSEVEETARRIQTLPPLTSETTGPTSAPVSSEEEVNPVSQPAPASVPEEPEGEVSPATAPDPVLASVPEEPEREVSPATAPDPALASAPDPSVEEVSPAAPEPDLASAPKNPVEVSPASKPDLASAPDPSVEEVSSAAPEPDLASTPDQSEEGSNLPSELEGIIPGEPTIASPPPGTKPSPTSPLLLEEIERINALRTIMSSGFNSNNLPNGAALTILIEEPETGDEFLVPPNQATIDVTVAGTATIGIGEPDASFIYGIDVSGSTVFSSGSLCNVAVAPDEATFLECEQEFIKEMNSALIMSGEADEVGLVVYGTSAVPADLSPAASPPDQIIIDPTASDAMGLFLDQVVNSTFSVGGGDGGVTEFTPYIAGNFTNCVAALQEVHTIATQATNNTIVAVIASDGECSPNTPTALTEAKEDLEDAGVIVNTVAIGTNSSCNMPGMIPAPTGDDILITLNDITVNGGTCAFVEDPDDLPDFIPEFIGAQLVSLTIDVDAGGQNPIPAGDIAKPLPLDGADETGYSTTAPNLAPGDHEICVTANGTDASSDFMDILSVSQCETIHLLQLTADPSTAVNNLNEDNEHTVTATILGDPGQVAGRLVDFEVMGQNAGASGTCSPNADCTTDASGQVSFTYSVPVEADSAGTDTIRVSTTIANEETFVEVTKLWLFLTAEPPHAVNELSSDNEHTVTASILPPGGPVSGILVNFNVTDQNVGASGTCSPNADCTTDASGQVSFTYSVPVEPDSLGLDTIEVSAVFGDQLALVTVTKLWQDTTPPVASCQETVNPHGGNVPSAPGNGGKGKNQDGFYEVTAEDDVWPPESLEVFVRDDGSGTIFGPYPSGVKVKYTQAPGAPPSEKKMGSNNGQANAVDFHLTGNGDGEIFAVDGTGNESTPKLCLLVPHPPQ